LTQETEQSLKPSQFKVMTETYSSTEVITVLDMDFDNEVKGLSLEKMTLRHSSLE
jgi:hypothetical protein